MASEHGPSLHEFREGGEAGTQAAVWVEAARMAARQGRREEARLLLRSAVQADPACSEAWLGLAWLAEAADERSVLLEKVLALQPDNAQARAELARLQGPAGLPTGPTGGRSALRRYWVWGALAALAVLVVVAFLVWGPVDSSLAWLLPTPTPTAVPTPTSTPAQVAQRFVSQLEPALSGADWDRALELVTIMRSLDASDPTVRRWSLTTFMLVGKSLVQAGKADQAAQHFDQALAVAPLDVEARLWKATTDTYLAGRMAMDAGGWDAAIQAFSLVRQQMPDYADALSSLIEAHRGKAQAAILKKDWTQAIETLEAARKLAPQDAGIVASLAMAYRERGIAREADEQLKEARADLEAALALSKDDAQAKAHLAVVMDLLFPPKRIEIDISQQRMYVYEGGVLIHKYVISTGLPGRDTAAGHFKVLDKIPMAYSSVWHLKMPYWLGIYFVGGIENGIHALPIRPDGSVMWAGLLGQRASYGCIILNNEAAKALYDWAEIGTKVDIHY